MKIGDPSDKALDAAADGNFGGKQTTNRRAGYGGTVVINGEELTDLEWLIRRAKKDATLASGEGRKIIEHYEAKLAEVEKERDAARSYFHFVETEVQLVFYRSLADQYKRILAALREPSEAVLKAAEPAMFRSFDSHKDVVWVIRAAVEAAEKEGQGE